MRENSIFCYALVIFALTAPIMTGCSGSTPARFYSLSAMKSPEPVRHTAHTTRGILVSLGPLSIPDYIDRPQIVTRSGQTELVLNEFHRWAGSLEHDIARVLAENLSVLLPAEHYQVVNWIRPAGPQSAGDYRVAVDIIRFDGAHGDAVLLKTRWSLFRTERDTLVMSASVMEQIKGNDYSALAEAMSRAVERLSCDIADTIMSLND